MIYRALRKIKTVPNIYSVPLYSRKFYLFHCNFKFRIKYKFCSKMSENTVFETFTLPFAQKRTV